MAEYIERGATIELLKSLGSRDYRREKGTIADAIKMLSHPAYTPAADVVEVKRGRWIGAEGETVGMVNGVPWSDCRCSVCGDYLTGSSEYPAKGNFCPNCGADMREGNYADHQR